MDYQQWSHVSSETNPTDCATRGLQPKELREHMLWWRGPQWLSENTVHTESTQVEDTHKEERIQFLTFLSNVDEEFIWPKYLSLTHSHIFIKNYIPCDLCLIILFFLIKKSKKTLL